MYRSIVDQSRVCLAVRDMCFPPIHRPPKQGKVLSLWKTVGGSDRIGFLYIDLGGPACVYAGRKIWWTLPRERKREREKLGRQLIFSSLFSRSFMNLIVRNILGYYPRFVLYTNSIALPYNCIYRQETNFEETYWLLFHNRSQLSRRCDSRFHVLKFRQRRTRHCNLALPLG